MQIINPTNEQHWLELRTKDITSTEIGALFGIHSASYIPTEFELWNRKKNNFAVDFYPNERVVWGKRLEDTIAHGVAEDNGWIVRKMTEYIRDPELRIGASFDFSIEPKPGDLTFTNDRNIAPISVGGLLEIKNVDSYQLKQKWEIGKDEETGAETIEAPLHIEVQVQHQLLVSGREFAYIAALVGGNKVILIKRERDAAVHEAIKEKAAAFWKSIDDNVPPTPNFERDAKFIAKLYGYAEAGKVFDARGNGELLELLRTYRQAQQDEKDAKARKDGVKAELLTVIGEAEKVTGDGWTVSAGMVAGGAVSYVRSPYRNFKPSFKKEFV